jgi:hypothetical protein
MGIDRPIFTIGTGRCGTTIFFKMLSHHKDLYWLSTLNEVFPRRYSLTGAYMRAVMIPIIGDPLKKRIKPNEAYRFWEAHCNGFSQPVRDLGAEDVTRKSRENIERALGRMLKRKEKRWIFKITGWSRIGYLNEIFPDARFIHVIRDGRAVVNSLMNIGFWKGWGGPQKWRWGMLSGEHQGIWEESGRSFPVLAAIEWKILTDSVRTAKEGIEADRFLQVRYEDLMNDPIPLFKEVTEFCDLDWSDRFEKKLRSYILKNMNYKWKENLPPSEQKKLNTFLLPYLGEYGYEE